MATVKLIPLRILSVLLVTASLVYCKEQTKPVVISEGNWKEVLDGEWLLEFYAPWCPACRSLTKTWETVAGWSEDLSIKVGHVDVTQNPGLSGRFLVTALPTIYHIKDGVFRQYSGSRKEKDFISYVDDKRWEAVEPVPWWKAPNSIQMGALGLFFKASMLIRTMHSSMTEDYNVPVWGSYAIFAVLTIIVGLLLGLMIVCMCDVIYPPRPQRRPPPVTPPSKKEDTDSDVADSQDADNSDIIEDDTKSEGDNVARKRKPKATTD